MVFWDDEGVMYSTISTLYDERQLTEVATGETSCIFNKGSRWLFDFL